MAAEPTKAPRSEFLILVPTYNEAENIEALLASIETHFGTADILVIDDNSPDGTQELVRQAQRLRPQRIHLLAREGKQGLAAAYIAGFDWGIEHQYRYLIQMDADFSHHPSFLPAFASGLRRFDVVTGSRYLAGGGTSGWGWVRQLISRGGNQYARLVLGLPQRDLTGGFNGWRREALENIDVKSLRSRGYAFQVELKYRAICSGFRLTEIPIHFENRRFGESKMSGSIVWEAALRVLQMRRYVRAQFPLLRQAPLRG